MWQGYIEGGELERRIGLVASFLASRIDLGACMSG
jgi:hypothetical protein